MTETKALPLAEFKVLDEAQGIVETIVAVSGIEDKVKDIIAPGALGKSLEARTPLGVWNHDWNTPVSKVVDIKELIPGDEGLPETKADGEPWPDTAGGLYVKAQFNLNTQAGREAFAWAEFLGKDQQWSIGYSVPAGGSRTEEKTGIRHIKSIDVYEFSQVIHGAMPITRTLTVKSLEDRYADTEIEPELAVELKSLVEHLLAEDESVDEAKAIIDEHTAEKADEEPQAEAEAPAEVEEPQAEEPEAPAEVEEEPEAEADEPAVEAEKSVDAQLAEALAAAMGDEAKGMDLDGVVERAMAIRQGVKYIDTVEISEDGSSESKVFTFVEESWEAIEHKVRVALRMQRKEIFGEDSGFPHVVATFGDRVIVEVFSDGDDAWFELSYDMGDEGIEFGEPTEVKLSTAVTAKSEWNDILWELKQDREARIEHGEIVKSSVAQLIKLLAAAGVEVEGEPEPEAKDEPQPEPETKDEVEEVETKDDDEESTEDSSEVIALKDLSPEERDFLLNRLDLDD